MTPKPLPPDQIKPLPLSVGIEEGRGGARKAPPPPPPAPVGWPRDEFGARCAPGHLPATAPDGFALPEKRVRVLADVTIERTLDWIDRYHVTWPTSDGLYRTSRTWRWTARLKARRMQRRIDAARAFNERPSA